LTGGLGFDSAASCPSHSTTCATRLTPSKLAQLEPAALSEFGHLLETFVVGELHKQASWLEGVYPPGHWRTHEGAEVDFVVEREDGCGTS
jgi:predicted AAA+ superfamily ATPase